MPFDNHYSRLFPGYKRTIVTSAKQSQDEDRHGEYGSPFFLGYAGAPQENHKRRYTNEEFKRIGSVRSCFARFAWFRSRECRTTASERREYRRDRSGCESD